jgi:ABC-type nitrate/sulfonate/bicarbonate transport system substrate-binding protein
MKNISKAALVIFIVFFAILGLFCNQSISMGAAQKGTTVRIAVTPFIDTALTLVGIEKGYFSQHKLDVRVVDASWDAQYDLLAAGAVDISMSIMDDLIARDKNLRKIDRQVVFFLPAWQFLGITFFSNKGFSTLDEIRSKGGEGNPIEKFLAQFKNKKIAFPQGGIYEHAFSKFIHQVGMELSDFNIVNSPLEVGLNGLEDVNVGLAAAAHQQRPEAIRRGYKQAIQAKDLGVFIITGFTARQSFHTENPDVLSRFICGWYKTAKYVKDNKKEAYDITRRYIEKRGGQVPSFDEYVDASKFNIIPVTPKETNELFLESSSPANWEKYWEGAAANLKNTDKEKAVPNDKTSFIIDDILNSSSFNCDNY